MSLGYSMGYAEGTDVPVEHLEYDYVNNCQNGPELEKILKILRSGREGVYPDLIKTTEERLREVKPDSKLLIKAQNITRVTDLPSDEWKTVNSDLQQWEKLITREEDVLKTGGKQKEKDDIVPDPDTNLPPVRKGGLISGKKNAGNSTDTSSSGSSSSHGKEPKSSARIKSYDFKTWDKYDVDKEVEKVDKEENNNKGTTSNEPATTRWNDELTEKERAMSSVERQKAGQREREKGNEAFRAGDHEEAVAYYTRSIKLYPDDAAAYNNRALVHIKLKRFIEAVADCKETLKREPANTKALLRCAIAHEALKDYQESVDLCQQLLRLEPSNKRCQELLNKVQEHYVPDVTRDTNRRAKGKRITIEEVDEQIKKETSEVLHKATGTPVSVQDRTEGTCTVGGSGKGKVPVTSSDPMPSSVPPPQPPVATPTPPVATPTPLPVNVQYLKDEGNDLFRVGQYGAAVTKYSNAIKLLEKAKGDHAHSLSTLLSNRAACHLKNGDCRSCIDDTSKALTHSPLNVKALIRRGMAYETMEKFRHAFVDYQLVLRIDPTIDKVQESSSRMTRLLRDQDGGNWRDKLPPNPDEDRILAALSTSTPPLVATPTQTNNKSIPDTPPTELIPPPPLESPQASSNLSTSEDTSTSGSETQTQSNQETFEQFKLKGNSFVKQGDYKSAIQHYTSCVDLCPDNVVGYTNRAFCYLKLKKFEECNADCCAALGLEPKNVKALYRRALARKELRKYQESLKDIMMVIELDPNNTAARKEKNIVHDLYLDELREIQATRPTPSSKDTGRKQAKKGSVRNPPEKPHASSGGVSSSSKVLSSVDREGQKLPETPPTSAPTKERSKKRKKIVIEEVGSANEDQKEVESETLQMGGAVHQEEETVPPVKVDLHCVKTEEVSVSQLIQLWNSLPHSATPLQYAELLLKIRPSLLRQVISNKLEGHTLTNIISAIDQHLIPEGFAKYSYEVLYVLTKVSRFSFIKMFLSASEKEVLSRIFVKLMESSAVDKDELVSLRDTWCA